MMRAMGVDSGENNDGAMGVDSGENNDGAMGVDLWKIMMGQWG